jgi:O-antigen/teichoic acid export membrane protein
VAFAAVLALDALLSASALAIAYRRFPAEGPWQFSAQRCRRLLEETWPFLIGGLLVVVYMRIDQITVKQVFGERDLGLYAAAVWLLQVWHVIPMTLSISLGPFIARRKALDELIYRRALVLTLRLFFYVGIAAAVGTLLAAPMAIKLVYGNEYLGAVPLLQAYSLTMPFYFLSLAHNLWLINEGRYMVRVYGAIAAGLVTIVCIVVLAPVLGVLAASVAAVAAQLVGSLLINVVLDKQAFRLQLDAIAFR